MSTAALLDDPTRFLLRPAQPSDLDGLLRLTAQRAIGISSLPVERAALEDRIARSCEAFAGEDTPNGDDTYLFVLEDRARAGALIGTAGIAACAGAGDRFFAYRNEVIVQASQALHARKRIHTLHLCHDLTGLTLLTGFHIEAAYAQSLAPQLLSRGRLLYIAQHAERFSDRIASENPGVATQDGRCPFWDAVGRRFFKLDYPAAEALVGGRSPKAVIADLLPQSPIYVALLPDEAQWSLGQLHPVGELPFDILMDEGFDGDTYVNVFDGGPTADARVNQLKTVRRRRQVRVQDDPAPPAAAATTSATAASGWQLVANRSPAAFRVMLLPHQGANTVALTGHQQQALGCTAGSLVACAALDLDRGGLG